MTALDFIKFGIIKTHEEAENLAEAIVDKWHEGLLSGDLRRQLGLSAREYQAWATGGVSLLTIANWQKHGLPSLSTSKPWFKISGTPGREKVGYLSALASPNKPNSSQVIGTMTVISIPSSRTGKKASLKATKSR